jgi:alpha-L-arabinofuranosidase
VEDGAYRQLARGEDERSVAGDPAWTDYTYSVKARKLGGAEGFLVMFRVRDNANWYWWNIGGWNNTQHALEKSEGGAKRMVGAPVPGSVETGRWYDVRVELRGNRIRCFLDGKLIQEVEDVPPPALYAAAGREDRSGAVILKVVNASDRPQAVHLELPGARLSGTADVTVLTSARAEDENSLEQPRKVYPVSGRLAGVGAAFDHTFPPNSLTIFRLSRAAR